MRKILFRGKTKSDKKWIYGNLLQTDNGTYVIQNYAPFEGIGKYEVDSEIVCQYTGLTDKNGLQKIFECDIISENGERIGNVYEKENIQPGTSYITITRMGTKEWEDTKQERDRCGLRYA